jgi:hypothetical protein
LFRKFVDLREELGTLDAVLWTVNRGFRRLGARYPIVKYYFVAQPVPEKPLLPPRRGRSVDVRRVARGDPALADLPLTDAVLRFRFGQDAVCFGAFQDGVIVGCLWLCLGRYDEDEVRCRFVLRPEGRTAWDFDVYVVPAARGGFAFMRLWDEANAYLRGLGVGWSLSRISAFNVKSLGAHGNLGARRIAGALFFRIGALQLMFSASSPFFHLSASERQVPRLTLTAPAAHPAG